VEGIAVVSFDLRQDSPGVVASSLVTAQAASSLTGYNIQYIRRLINMGRLQAIRVGRSWLITLESLEDYLNVVVPAGDGRFGPRGFAKTQDNHEASTR
jgi:excisionase family DNA binding protein